MGSTCIATHQTFKLHGYQIDYLNTLAVAQGLAGPGDALQAIVDLARSDPTVKNEIFGDFFCVHCGSVDPPAWIKSRKGKKVARAPPAASGAADEAADEAALADAMFDGPSVPVRASVATRPAKRPKKLR